MAKKAKNQDTDNIPLIRNIGIIAHIDAGKTTTTERILYYTGKSHQLGNVDDGTTTTDFNPDEQTRGITIETAAVSCKWTPRSGQEHTVTILDTPGHVDFTAEVERSLRVLDGAVGVFCAVGGVEAQSETVWRQADNYKVPRIAFVNKLDRSGADFDAVVEDLEERLEANPVILQRPIGLEKDFHGVIDLIEKCTYYWKDESLGADYIRKELGEDEQDEYELYREQLLNSLSDIDDDFAGKYLEENFTSQDIRQAIRKATLERKITPVLCGTALRNKGVQLLLDAVCDYLPSPLERPAMVGKAPKRRKRGKMDSTDTEDWLDETRRVDPKEDFSALVFKSITDKHTTLFFFRIYSGTLRQGQMVLNLTQNKKERIGTLYVMHAKLRQQVEVARAGDIVSAVGFRYTRTGDTLCDANAPILYENISFPDTVVSRAVEPKSTADQDKLLNILQQLERDDPTFRYSEDKDTRQLIISGMGELHLEILKNRIERNHGIEAKFRELRVAYKQTLASKGTGTGTIDRELPSGKVQFAELKVEVMRSVFGNLGPAVTIGWAMGPDEIAMQVPKQYWPAIEEGLKGAASGSYSWGYPLIQTHVQVTGGRFDPVNSSAEAFQAAASFAFDKAVEAAGVELLEPVMALEVTVPEEKVGDVINDLNRRGADIQSQLLGKGGLLILKGRAPLASMFGYADDVRSLTGGRGSFSMEPASYELVPESRRPKLY